MNDPVLNETNYRKLAINSRTAVFYEPDLNLLKVVDNGKPLIIPGASKIISWLLEQECEYLHKSIEADKMKIKRISDGV